MANSRPSTRSMTLNKAFLKLPLRAEGEDSSLLVETFVDAGHLFTLLSNDDHQVLYGRRGTGKTHALKYLAETLRRKGQVALFVDMRTLGSSAGLYSDDNAPLPERATRLLVDVLASIHDQLVNFALTETPMSHQADARLLPRLDALADEATQVRVLGPVERAETLQESSTDKVGAALAIDLAAKVRAEVGTESVHGSTVESKRVERGQEVHRINFGGAAKRITDVVQSLPEQRLWIILDEWSVVPRDLQPYLADFLRRCVLPVAGATVKIGAIEQRTKFRIVTAPPDYVGIELGSDISANLDLDDFMVFNNDAERAKTFMRDLLYRHVVAIYDAEGGANEAPKSAEDLVAAAFTQVSAFAEFVRAAEGVPRDAVNILGLAVQKAGDEKISVTHVRVAARTWYQRDKLTSVNASDISSRLLKWIVSEVIGTRHARAFLLEQGREHAVISVLYDARVLHVLKRGVHGGDVAGVRFDAYALDYGCYVDLISTVNAPLGLFQIVDDSNQEKFVEVPSDDYRSIRRAILDLDKFDRRVNGPRN